MKKGLLLLAILTSAVMAFAHPPVNEKVTAAFNASFPNAGNVVWTEFENFYQVYFVKDEVQYRVYYDFNGNVLKSRSDYPGHKLNPFLTAKLLKKFPDKKIFMVNEVNTEQETFYLVHLEGQHDWVQVHCDPTGNVTVTARLKKS